MAKTVTTIPATLTRFTAAPINQVRRRRTAGYARVSTDSEEQQTSYEAQVDYYTNYIKSRDDWEFVEVYTDVDSPYGLNPKARECLIMMARTGFFVLIVAVYLTIRRCAGSILSISSGVKNCSSSVVRAFCATE